jgi:hypothetical protein
VSYCHLVEFFVPQTSTPEQAEKVWEATRKFAAETMDREIGTRRIFRLEYRHDGDDLVAEVGQPEPLTGEPVLVILEADPYLICTPSRGVARGIPILAGAKSISRIVDFTM